MILLNDFFQNPETAYTFVKMLVPVFMAILFLQSGIDKILNFKDNYAYFTEHFKNSPLSNWVGFMTPVITALEVVAGLLCAFGVFTLIYGNKIWAFWGLMTAAVALLCLFFGQRLAKDYAGAVTLATYFALVVIGLLILV